MTSSPPTNTTRSKNPADWIPHGSVVSMWLHRGGGYYGPEHRSSSIFEGGDWVQKEGIIIHVPIKSDAPYAKDMAPLAYFIGFDGDFQATCPDRDYCYFPDGPKTFIRAATTEDAAHPKIAEALERHHWNVTAPFST